MVQTESNTDSTDDEHIAVDSDTIEECKFGAEIDGSLIIQDLWIRDGDSLIQHRVEWMWDYVFDRYNREHYTFNFDLDGDIVSHNGCDIGAYAQRSIEDVMDPRPRIDFVRDGDIRSRVGDVGDVDDMESLFDN